MQKKYVVLIAICSVLITSFFMNSKVTSYKNFAIKTEQSNKKLKKQVSNLKSENSSLNSQIDVGSSKENNKTTDTNDSKLRSFLNLMLNYTNANFVSRFDKANVLASQQAVSVFQVTKGNVEVPKTTISSQVTDYKFYSDMTSNGTKGLAVVKVDFKYQGQTQHNVNEYEVELAKDGTVLKLAQRVIGNDN